MFKKYSIFTGLLIVIIAFAINFSYPFDFAGIHKIAEPFIDKLPNNLRKDFSFTEKSEELGISFAYQEPEVSESFMPVSIYLPAGGVAVGDVNNDGWMDFYVVTSKGGEKNHLYINQQGEGFVDQADIWQVADLNKLVIDRKSTSVTATFFDYNNDGLVDLYLSRIGCSALYKNTGTKFEEVTQQAKFLDCNNNFGAVPFDYNLDGNTDLYVYRYQGHHDLFSEYEDGIWTESAINSKNGGLNNLFRNNGDGTFTNVTQNVGGGSRRWTLDAAVGYFTNTETLELMLANDFGPDQIYQIESGKLIDRSELLGFPDRRMGMNVSAGYLQDDPLPLVHISNIYFPGYVHEGNFLKNFNNGQSSDDASKLGTNNCLWAWGASFADFDLNAELELYVANGFVSGPVQTRNDFEAGIIAEQLRDQSFTMGIVRTLPGFFTRNLQTVRNIITTDEAGNINYAGHQNDCFFWYDNDRFVNIARHIGIDENWDGRAVATIDYDNNGSLDLIVTTRNKGLKFFKNNVVPKNNWIGLELESRQNIIGSKIEVRQKAKTWRRFYNAGKSGFLAISDPRIHVGLVDDSAVDIKVTWPKGNVSKLKNVRPGRYLEVSEQKQLTSSLVTS